jgi:hypothetical protein
MTEQEDSVTPIFTHRKVALSFVDSKKLPLHRWYPYVEGFSAGYAAHVLDTYGRGARAVYDPFGGSGTTQLEASLRGMTSFFCEVNPFMAFVADTKINVVSRTKQNPELLRSVVDGYVEFLNSVALDRSAAVLPLEAYERAFPERDFFEERHIRHLLAAREAIQSYAAGTGLENLLLLAIASIAVDSSNMTRRADLRRRRPDEYKNRVVDVPGMLSTKLESMVEDILTIRAEMVPTRKVGADSKQLTAEFNNSFDLVLTSPPYLNGTNYFRNTKIELWISGFIEGEAELAPFTTQAVASGINNVSKRRAEVEGSILTPEILEIVEALNEHAYDQRIPKLVQSYFEDMYLVLRCSFNAMREGAAFILDIGDSKFAGVHVPVDDLLVGIAKRIGYEFEASNHLAKRYSRDKTELRQVELIFVKPKRQAYASALPTPNIDEDRIPTVNQRLEKAQLFQDRLPYKDDPYSGRNWGHELHSLCCYQGKFKPAQAHWLVREFTSPGMVVLDPLGGVGTIALEACLQGRRGITSDLSPFASVVGRAKVDPPQLADALAGVDRLESALTAVTLTEDDEKAADFGLNSRVRDYYHEDTLREVLRARRYYLECGELDQVGCFLKASLLHILHGNRPYALSRVSHPITPFSPTGDAEYRPLIERIRRRIKLAYREELPVAFKTGQGFHSDFRDLMNKGCPKVDCVITSPPFIGMRFDRPNWLRMWFCGWLEDNFHKTSLDFLERQQSAKKMDVYSEFFAACDALLRDTGFLLVHIGGSEKYDMRSSLARCASPWFKLAYTIIENVEAVEKHGIKDKGTTTSHQILLFERN